MNRWRIDTSKLSNWSKLHPLAQNEGNSVFGMISPIGLGFSPRRVTVSTAGMVPQILKLWEEVPVNLSISLNATTNEVRDQIMPKVNRLYPIEELLKVCQAFPLPSRRRITFEYVLLAGVNDTPEDAARLVRLSHGIRCKINLIPFNPFPSAPYRSSPPEVIERFGRILHAAGLIATTRKTRGDDIDAACGQLVGRVSDRSRRRVRLHVAP